MSVNYFCWVLMVATIGSISCKERQEERVEEYWEERVQHNLRVADLTRSPWKLIDTGDVDVSLEEGVECDLNFTGPDKPVVVRMGQGRFEGMWKISGWRMQIQELATKPWTPLPGSMDSRISNVAEWGIDDDVLTLKGRDGKWMKFQRDTKSASKPQEPES